MRQIEMRFEYTERREGYYTHKLFAEMRCESGIMIFRYFALIFKYNITQGVEPDRLRLSI